MRQRVLALLCVGLVAAWRASTGHADEPLRAARRHAWSAGLELSPIPLPTVGLAVNVTPWLAFGGVVGSFILASRAELQAKLYLTTAAYSPYLYIGGALLDTMGPGDEGSVQGYRAGGVVGLGFEAASWRGQVFDIHVCLYALDMGTEDSRLCPGGGFAIGGRW